ncbi:MAG: hypothetical protein H7Y30_04935, partial [Pyrinomonadaceae bacterium]|nr:hypothetical protein [Pyrinomonadaceae bacterium]
AYADESWAGEVLRIKNPFGEGDSGKRIAEIIAELLQVQHAQEPLAVNV